MCSHGLGQSRVGSLQGPGGYQAPVGRPRLQVEGGHEGSESWWCPGPEATRTLHCLRQASAAHAMPALAVLSS